MQNNMNKKRNKKGLIGLLIFLLLIIIIICYITLVSFSQRIETQEIDIKIPKKVEPIKNKEETKKNKNILSKIFSMEIPFLKPKNQMTIKKINTPNDNNSEQKPPEKEIIDPGIFSVRDSNLKWETDSELKIFEKTSNSFVAEGKVAPGIESTYNFTIRNNNDFDVIYTIKFNEDNGSNINMLYKAKKNNAFILNTSNNWISIKDKNIETQELSKGEKDNYSLTWKWFEGTNDTAIGINKNLLYDLSITVEVEQKI